MAGIVARVVAIGGDIVSEVRKNLVGTVAKALAAIVIAGAALAWTPLSQHIVEPIWRLANGYLYPERILSADEAMRIARWRVGKDAIVAVPFRNAADPNDYVLVWAEHAAVPEGQEEMPGPLGSGAAEAVMLIGLGGSFERIDTRVPALPGHFTAEALVDRDTQAKEATLVDWNGDGSKEIFAVADQDAMTSAEHTYNLTLYDTASRKAEQMAVSVDRNGGTRSRFTGTDQRMRAWFLARFDEYMKSYLMSDCQRVLAGPLNCAKAAEPDDGAGQETADRLTVFTGALIDKWVVANGADFTRGALKLPYQPVPPDVDLASDGCALDAGDFTIFNYFKGPMLIARKSPREASILYLQDGGHHREIPRIILGRRYIWMALAVTDAILAIDRRSFEVVGMQVPKWKTGIPSLWTPGNTLAAEQAAEGPATKELQLEGLDLAKGKLVYGEKPLVLSPSVAGLADEFKDARLCDGPEARPDGGAPKASP